MKLFFGLSIEKHWNPESDQFGLRHFFCSYLLTWVQFDVVCRTKKNASSCCLYDETVLNMLIGLLSVIKSGKKLNVDLFYTSGQPVEKSPLLLKCERNSL